MIDGRVQVRVNGGQGEIVLETNSTFNDGKFHAVVISKKRKEVELRIDDAYQTSQKLRAGVAIRAPESGGLYFGGLPSLINDTKMVATNAPLRGAIKDVIFNEECVFLAPLNKTYFKVFLPNRQTYHLDLKAQIRINQYQ